MFDILQLLCEPTLQVFIRGFAASFALVYFL